MLTACLICAKTCPQSRNGKARIFCSKKCNNVHSAKRKRNYYADTARPITGECIRCGGVAAKFLCVTMCSPWADSIIKRWMCGGDVDGRQEVREIIGLPKTAFDQRVSRLSRAT